MNVVWSKERKEEAAQVVHFLKKDDAFEKRPKLYRHLGVFEGKCGEVLVDAEEKEIHYYIGLGMSDDLDAFSLKKAMDKGLTKIKVKGPLALDLDVDFVMDRKAAVHVIGAAFEGSQYTFDHFKSDKETKEAHPLFVTGYEEEDKASFEAGLLFGEAQNIAKYLVDMPANVMTPVRLGKEVSDLGEKHGFEVLLKDREAIEEMGMGAFLAVSAASSHSPRFIVMHYCHPDMKNAPKVGLVGKGLCYDSGGLSIKPTSSMVDMKSDMAGSAAVIGAMSILAKTKAKVNVVAAVAACENAISGTGYRPGDIVKSKGGKTIFVGNTDAEGRLTLIDAMHYVLTDEKVDMVMDIATLTGAAVRCGGKIATPCISNQDALFSKFMEAGQMAGERYFRMPIYPEYQELIKHSVADLTNIAGDPGTVTAGLFVGAYVPDTTPWIHIDIAGTAMKEGCGINPIPVASGVAAGVLYQTVRKIYEA